MKFFELLTQTHILLKQQKNIAALKNLEIALSKLETLIFPTDKYNQLDPEVFMPHDEQIFLAEIAQKLIQIHENIIALPAGNKAPTETIQTLEEITAKYSNYGKKNSFYIPKETSILELLHLAKLELDKTLPAFNNAVIQLKEVLARIAEILPNKNYCFQKNEIESLKNLQKNIDAILTQITIVQHFPTYDPKKIIMIRANLAKEIQNYETLVKNEKPELLKSDPATKKENPNAFFENTTKVKASAFIKIKLATRSPLKERTNPIVPTAHRL